MKIVHYGGIGSCKAPGIGGKTDHDGRFSARRWRWFSAIDLALVIVQIDTLCVDLGSGWHPIWSVPYGPASSKLRWTCDLNAQPESTRNRIVRGICAFATGT